MDTEERSEDRIEEVGIAKELRDSYLAYSVSVIKGRAIPDARDGLKPVHRRILYAMSELGNTYNRPYKKSARVVGDVIGKYHPHGDSAVYDALVRMAQDFSMRDPLVDGQGNFGSIDGDSPAAMRYTEVRMAKLAGEFLGDIDKDTVDFRPNYDGSLDEPAILPTKVPNLLLNGSSGIAVGMATNIPTHNLGELCDALTALLDNPQATVDDLMQFVKGPDFPTRGEVYAGRGLYEAYHTGRGSIRIRGRVRVEERKKGLESLVIYEIPYGVNKSVMVERIAALVNEKKIGCIGASYGGFMTQYLQTKTDLFAAAISHAGISALSSYWGEGYWGIGYCSTANTNTYPWNAPEFYTEHSPLFHADKIQTPLLLLHGNADTNVPIGESIQMFAAMKILGKEVEFVQVDKQDHHIVDYSKRTKWQNTIFAWFAKWLKDEPEWWEALYPKRDL